MFDRLRITSIALLVCGMPAFAGTVFTFSGSFSSDDNLRLFTYSVQNQAQVDIFTTSYVSGGFSPVLTLFDATGLFQNESRGLSGDASLSWISQPGEQYLIVLSQYDNVSF